MIPSKIKHIGDWTLDEMSSLSKDELMSIILNNQEEFNFIIMSDSYKQTHHLIAPKGLKYTYSYMESRGGDYDYTVMNQLQYYLIKYIAGVRITKEKIEEAARKNVEHFGYDCFNWDMWNHILNVHGGKLPLKITAVPEGTPVATKNVIMDIINTDDKTASLTQATETLLMKLWAPNTVATYARYILAIMTKYHKLTSDMPLSLVEYNHVDFGYRGVSSEESARILGSAALLAFKSTDNLGAISNLERYYDCPMAGYSVVASEHSVVCSYGDKTREKFAYENMIKQVKKKIQNVDNPTKTFILSLVSDTNNIYNVCYNILWELRDLFIDWVNDFGCKLKIVVRPDSGKPVDILFGCNNVQLISKVANDMNITLDLATDLVNRGVVGILADRFGYTINSKGFNTLHPQIGVLQGDGISYSSLNEILITAYIKKWDTGCLVFGSGGKFLQCHERDDQKYAIKATQVQIFDEILNIKKNPITDSGKESKTGMFKLHKFGPTYKDYKTVSSLEPEYDSIVDFKVPVFLNGEILKYYTFDEMRENYKLTEKELNEL